MTPDTETAFFSALAHPDRRRILDLLRLSPGSSVGEIASHFDSSRIATMKHLAVLEDAGLLISEKEGRVRKHWFNVVPIQRMYERWTDEYSSFWAGRLGSIQERAESRAAERREEGEKRA